MTLFNEVRTRLTTAMKDKKDVEKGILRVLLGELATTQGRTGKEPSDEDVKRVVKKLIQSNDETRERLAPLSAAHHHEKWLELGQENEVLATLVPPALTRNEIHERIMLAGAPIHSQIREAKSEGQAVGACIKYLKSYNWDASGEDVKAVVQELRK